MDYGAFIYLEVYSGSCIPSFIGSDGFKVLEVVDGLSSLNGFVFGLVSNDITSFQSLRQLEVCVGRSPAPSGVRISRFPFSLDIRDFLSSCHGTHVWQFEICASFSSRLLGVSEGRVPRVIHASLSVCIDAL